MDPIIIIGAGMAAYAVARELRKLDPAARLLLISADGAGAYAKPMLSNAIALGKGAGQLQSHSAEQMAAQLDATILARTPVRAIDCAARRVHTAHGSFAYARLVLAVGAQPIRLALDGDGADQVLSVNHLDHYAQLRARLDPLGRPARVAILGAGLIGCEFADDLIGAGHHVTLVDPNRLPLAALAAPALSHGLAAAWRGRAVDLRLGTTASAVWRAADGSLELALADGSTVAADLVLSAVGLRPDVALAQAAGLATRRGIVVDAFGRSSDAHVYALGDCAEYSHAGGPAVLPYVAPMLAAARAIAATLAGTPTAIALKTEAVMVKTPSYRLALAPPPAACQGRWIDATDGEHTVARFVDEAGVLRGFGVAPPTPALRQRLLTELDAGAA